MTEPPLLALARSLADVLMHYARERNPDDKKEIARLHTELCAARRRELDEPPVETNS